ncbi:MAG: hypothetical protein Q9168_007765 [Polycauliona sp. 1 TL-2023]
MLYGGPGEPVPFWIDSLCVPLQDPPRGLAINSMRRTYKEADKVLVLDSAITRRLSDSMSALEMVARLRTSSWVRRLWTFHEAYLARALHYQFKDTAITLADMRKRFHKEGNTEFDETEYQCGGDSCNTGHEMTHNLDGQPKPLSDKTKNVIEQANLIWSDADRFLRNVDALGKFEPQEDHRRLKSIVHPLRWRTTSRMIDEIICLSGCLDRKVEELDELETPPARMKHFLNSLTSVPAGLMFVDRPRFEDDGYRWMPLSLLSGGNGSTLPDTWGGGEHIGYPTSAGLIVTLPGILLRDIHWYKQAFRGGHVHEIIFIKDSEESFFVYALLAKPIIWSEYSSMDLALIMCGQLDARGTFSALVQVEKVAENLTHCKFLACAMILGNPQIHRNLNETTFTKTSRIDASQRWCVG